MTDMSSHLCELPPNALHCVDMQAPTTSISAETRQSPSRRPLQPPNTTAPPQGADSPGAQLPSKRRLF
jgi:hypothetical protein